MNIMKELMKARANPTLKTILGKEVANEKWKLNLYGSQLLEDYIQDFRRLKSLFAFFNLIIDLSK